MALPEKDLALASPVRGVSSSKIDVSAVRDRVLAAAQAIVAGQGLAALKARAVVEVAGCSVGSLYNAYADLDDLVVAVNRRTLLRLDARLEEACSGVEAEQALGVLAQAYLAFAIEETNALRALFEHRMRDGRPLPDDHLVLVDAIFSRIARSLAVLLPAMDASEISILSRTMFSSVHGVIMLGLEERLVAVPCRDLHGQVVAFVATYLKGLVC